MTLSGKNEIRRALVTGGAGFIGSHVVDHLIGSCGAEVTVYDNFSTGQRLFLKHHAADKKLKIVEGDVLDLDSLKNAMMGVDHVFHFQANADVRGGMEKRRVDLEQNTMATWNVLEAMVEHKVCNLAFASSATVYGEPTIFPTPEDCPCVQTSLYGASKYACEAMIQAYGEYFDIRSCTFRFVSWTGERYTHGVLYDFLRKLKADPRTLEILGDGRQKKSYLDVTDGVAGIFTAVEKAPSKKNVYNLGHDDFLNVLDLADIVCDELGLPDVEYVIAGGARGWLGDSPMVQLDTSRLKSVGWAPRVSIEESIRRTVRYLTSHESLLDVR